MSTTKQALSWFRNVALIEGLSLIVLLTFSVLKRTTTYAWAVLGVQYIGMAHGLLFIAYVYLLWACASKYRWNWRRVALFLFASIIPFAPFFVERKLKDEMHG
ncbi:DUF3817 domain-containing protein [Parapedobacter koreensis]|uniref:Integral membrane protein n=1 Tax=Parapedobacter koreensis TaxID=332977 RepID=A0A1H7J9H1_9SPHI|nr:DUF3817 domain-containing protein [Parapedobacter koreensis]SEK70620.1 integral membrane protein [Parapedobacter koreensis]